MSYDMNDDLIELIRNFVNKREEFNNLSDDFTNLDREKLIVKAGNRLFKILDKELEYFQQF